MKKTKKAFVLALAAVMAIGMFAGCGKKKNDDVLKVAVSPDFAPMEFVDPSKSGQDQYVGFDVSLAKYIAEGMGKELEIQPMSFDACQTAVYTGTVDMAISGFSWTEERAENYNMSDYYHAGENEENQVLITLKKNEGKFVKAEDMDGIKIGAQTSSLQETLCKTQLPNSQVIPVGDLGTGILQLQKGDFDCMVVADGNADAFIAKNPDVIKSGFSFEVDEKYVDNVVLLKKGADELTTTVNELLAKAKADGLYDVWYKEAMELAEVTCTDPTEDAEASESTEDTVTSESTENTTGETSGN